MFNWCVSVALCSEEEIALKPLQNSVLCTTRSAVSDDLLVVVICVTRVFVELIILTEIVGNVVGFVILMVTFVV